ncbi:hypothetical protein [Hungatella effluvii]|uniref:hypothetical protein n=1 Tax=Hungatella effluvii TaxID=1096246 RepID=UPI0022DEE37B|nr:hypothetical protein [Hungatella effluvii]
MKQREKTVSILDRLSWSVQPPKGLIKGCYYREEARFSSCFNGDLGHLGVLEVVADDGRIVMVEFNEQCSPTYYMRHFQNVDKRLSDYGFFQASKERTAVTGVVLVNGITSVEKQMVAANRLTGDFDLVAGASNSIKRSMLPLAEKIAARMSAASPARYYGLAKELEPGVTGRLQIVVEAGKIVRLFYDEIFADTQEEISDPELKQYYRQSKYHCPDYISTSGAGFNNLSDLITMSVLKHQNLLGFIDLPYTEEDNRAPEWDRYLSLARPLQEEMEKDGVWKPADYIPVLDSTVLSVQVMTADDGRPLHLLELEYPDFTYEPGQFVMIQNQGDGFHWSYPYMIYEATDRGLKVIAAKNSSLFSLSTGAETAIWGANGIGCAPGTNAVFVAEPATIHLLAPLIHACATPTLFLIGSQSAVPKELLPSVAHFVSDGAQALKHLMDGSDPIYMALNVPVLESIMNCAADSLKERTMVFASTRIGCGIGACKSCYLHSPDIQMGIPVCCNGPYLPFNMIDIDKDRKCFQTFK